jgi:hypothetical protein
MTATNPALKNTGLAYAVGVVQTYRLPLTIAAGVPSFEGVAKPDILVEKGLAGSQAILTQTLINTLLGSTNEVVASACFGTTAMAADNTLGFVLDCDGQVAEVRSVRCVTDITTTGAIPGLGYGTATALTDATFYNPEIFVSASGNIAGRVTYSNLTATGTAGRLVLELDVVLK